MQHPRLSALLLALRCTYARPFYSCHGAQAMTTLWPRFTELTGEVSSPKDEVKAARGKAF